MVYLIASTNEKMYSDYLQVVREAEKEEVMEQLHNWTTENKNKPKAIKLLSLMKAEGQPAH